MGNVWLRGLLELLLIDGTRDLTVGVKGLSEERKGDVGLVTLADREGAVSREVVL